MSEDASSADGSKWLRPWRQTFGDPALHREADMMGLYLAIALIAELSLGQDHAKTSDLRVLAIVWGTTIGLALAHWFALGYSSRLVHDPGFHHTPAQVLLSQIAMAVTVALIATVVVLVTPPDAKRFGARLAAAAFIALLVLVESRNGGLSRRQALSRGVVALVLACAVVAAKWFLK